MYRKGSSRDRKCQGSPPEELIRRVTRCSFPVRIRSLLFRRLHHFELADGIHCASRRLESTRAPPTQIGYRTVQNSSRQPYKRLHFAVLLVSRVCLRAASRHTRLGAIRCHERDTKRSARARKSPRRWRMLSINYEPRPPLTSLMTSSPAINLLLASTTQNKIRFFDVYRRYMTNANVP